MKVGYITNKPEAIHNVPESRNLLWTLDAEESGIDYEIIPFPGVSEGGNGLRINPFGIFAAARSLRRRIAHLDIAITALSPNVVPVMVACLLVGGLRPRWVPYFYWKNSIMRRSAPVQLLLTQALGLLVRRARAVLMMFPDHQDFFVRALGIPSHRIHCLPPCVDVNFFSPQRGAGNAAGDFILSVGADRGRDYETLFEAISGLDIQLVVVGRGLKRRLANIPPGVIVLDGVSYEELRTLYQECRFVVVPTCGRKAGGDHSGTTVVLEAMAMGKTVLLSGDETEFSYLIQNGVNGVVISPENASLMREKLTELLRCEPEVLMETSCNARRTVESGFSTQKGRQMLVQILRSLNGKSTSRLKA